MESRFLREIRKNRLFWYHSHTMLVEFRFGNFRSFREEQTLSLVAASKLQGDPERDRANVFLAREKPELKLLRAAAIYGANASGKSNAIRALNELRTAAVRSADTYFELTWMPFLLDEASRGKPARREIVFLLPDGQYRYGFELAVHLPHESVPQWSISAEWLYRASTSVESLLFERRGDQVTLGDKFREGRPLIRSVGNRPHIGTVVRHDALLLSLSAQIGGAVATGIASFMKSSLRIVTGLDDESLREGAIQMLGDSSHKGHLLQLLRVADETLSDITVADLDDGMLSDVIESSKIPNGMHDAVRTLMKKQTRLRSFHARCRPDGTPMPALGLAFENSESQGTQKLFAYAAPIIETLANSGILVIDEMDARFHPLLTREIVRLFQSPETNPKNAQIIFATHDTNLLDPREFRRDQIWFVEKDRFGASHLYSLAEFKGIRKDADFEQEYLRGRYGAVPFLGGFAHLLDETAETSEEQPANAAG
jgi:hypothetical protein